jgi:hypothetical protein
MKMKKPKSPKVPVLEDALELNLPKLMRAAQAAGSDRLVLDDGEARTVVLLSETRLAAFLGGQAWVADIVAVACLGGRSRRLLKCSRAHEGNFQSLYFKDDVLACRLCHRLRYRSNLAASTADRARLARNKLLRSIGGKSGDVQVPRQPYKWRSRHELLARRLFSLLGLHFDDMRTRLERKKAS